MAVRELVFEGAAVLAEVAIPRIGFGSDLGELVEDMFDTMYDAKGRGLAAPQVGVSERVFVMDATWKTGSPEPRHFVNPVILGASAELLRSEEACLSIPGKSYRVVRPVWIDLLWQDLQGNGYQDRLTEFACICACHEIDHLNGVMIPQRGALI